MKQFSSDFIYQLMSLIVAILLVHAIYVAVIRPNANSLLETQAELINADPTYVPERSAYIIVKDLEQEACFILMLWAMALMGIKARDNHRERALFEIDLHRFRATGNIQDVAHTIRATCESESEHLDSELSMIRYIAWAIPSIGFLGTVRGIGQALGQAHQAAQGDIAGVTQSLGVAFNSTFVALLISILIMFLMHQLQLAQERTTQDTEQYCDNRLLRYLQV